MPYGTLNADKVVNSDSITSGGLYGFKNRIINGAMMIDQRNAGASVTVGTGAFITDRFRATEVTDGTATGQQSSTAPAGFVNSILFTVTGTDSSLGATQYASIEQRVEGLNVADFAWGTASAAPITISFWVRSSVTGTYCVGLYNSSGNRSYTAEYTISSANTWEQKTITVAGDTTGTWLTTNGIGVLLSFTLAVGSSYQQAAGSWGSTAFAIGTSNQTNLMATSGATFYITGVQLEKGSTATSFDYRPYGTELMLCQRYYYRTAPGALDKVISNGYCSSTTVVRGITPFMVSMRTSPSALEQTGVASDYSVYPAAGEFICSAVPTFGSCSQEQAWTNFTVASGLTSGQGAFAITNATGAYLAWSAEL